MAGDGQLQHGAALVLGGVQGRALPRVGRRDQLHLGQAERAQGVVGERDVRDMGGVETAAQEPDTLHTQSRGVR